MELDNSTLTETEKLGRRNYAKTGGTQDSTPYPTAQTEPKTGDAFNPYNRFNISPIPEEITRYRGLSMGAKVVYGRLCRYGGENGKVYPAVATIGDECGVSESSARVYLKELVDRKFICVEEQPGSMNSYVFLWHAAFDGDRGVSRKDFKPANRRKITARPLQKTEPPPVPITEGGTPSVNWTPPVQMTEHERESVKRVIIKESQIKESQASPASQSEVPTSPEIKSTPSESLRVDDEKPTPL